METSRTTSQRNNDFFIYEGEHKGSNITAASLDLRAGNDLTVSASNLSASGTASLIAGKDLSVVSGLDEFHSFAKWKHGKQEKRDFTVAPSNITAGGSLSLTAGADASKGAGNLVVFGSNVSADADLNLSASGDVAVSSAESSDFYHYENRKRGLASSKSSLTYTTYSHQVSSNLSGGNVNITAGNNILIAGSNLAAADNLALSADKGDIMIAAAQNVDTYLHESKFGLSLDFSGLSFAEFKQSRHGQYSETNTGSLLTAGGDIRLDAGRDLGIIGSKAVAGNDLDMFAGRDVNLTPGSEAYNSQSETKKGSSV